MSNNGSEHNLSNGSSDINVDPEVLERMLRIGNEGPLRTVEELVISDIPVISPHHLPKRKGERRGPKSLEEWISEIRRCWTYCNDEDKLAGSWIAFVPQVQKISVSKYGGGLVGRGRAMKELLAQALQEAKKHNTDEKTLAVLSKYPHVKKREIADEFGMTREQFSRSYVSKATKILTITFLSIIGRKVNA